MLINVEGTLKLVAICIAVRIFAVVMRKAKEFFNRINVLAAVCLLMASAPLSAQEPTPPPTATEAQLQAAESASVAANGVWCLLGFVVVTAAFWRVRP